MAKREGSPHTQHVEAPRRWRRRRVELVVAIIGVIGLVLSGGIAAGVSVLGTAHLQDRDDRREDRHELVQARGAARVLYAELFQASTQIAILGGDRVFRRFDPTYAIDMRPDDMRLVASRLTGEQWGDVSDALAAVQGLETFVNTPVERGRRRLTTGEVCFTRVDVQVVYYAAKALADLAGAPGARQPDPPPPECTPQPGPVPRGVLRGP